MEISRQSIDVVLERPQMGRYRWAVYATCAGLLAVEGYDAYLVSNLAPVIARGLSVPIAAMGAVFSAQAVGFAVAYYTIPMLADLIGRRGIIIACAALFAVLTYATTQVSDFNLFVLMRFLAFVALGGTLPNVVALAAEFLPKSRQGSLLTWLFIGHGLGGAAAGFLGSFLISYYSWHVPFWIGSVVLLFAVPYLYISLPESCRYLIIKNNRDPRIGKILRKVDPGLHIEDDVIYETGEIKAPGLPLAGLFRDGRLPLTLLLWIANAATFYTAATLTAWLPSFISVLGAVEFRHAARMASVSAFGSIFGPFLLVLLTKRVGPLRALSLTLIAGGIIMSLLSSISDIPALGWVFGFCFGLFVIGAQAGLNSLNASSYPTAMRSTGIGWAAGLGRVSSAVGPGLAGAMLANHWTPNAIYFTIAAPLFLAASALALLYFIRAEDQRKSEPLLQKMSVDPDYRRSVDTASKT
jgi:MFS transporter, AAHS family, 4-hydroxybenzoate transporter